MARPNKKARRILGRVLRWLEAGAPHVDSKGRVVDGFDMGYAVEVGDCGTVCCIAGAVCQFEGLGELTDRGEMDYFRQSEPLAVEALGIPYKEARALFMPFDKYDVEAVELTPAVAARTLLHYIRTGQVVWEQENGAPFLLRETD
jgi:hypothetical protein